MGRDRGPRAGAEGRVRYVRRHVDERGRQPRRPPGGLRPARRHLHDARRRNGGIAGDPDHYRSRFRHAASLQPRRQAHRVLERSRRAMEHLDDGHGREEREAGVARAALVYQQSGVVGRRQLHLCPPPLRRLAIARRGGDLDVPRRRVRRASGHREERLPEGCRRAGRVSRRALPLLQQGRHARTAVRVQQGPERHHLRDHPARSEYRARADGGVGPGRLRHASRQPGRQVARLRAPGPPGESALPPRPRNRP